MDTSQSLISSYNAMSNHISHNFQQLREIHPWTIFQSLFQNTPVVLSHDAMMYIYDYLVPMHVDLNAPIRIFYEHKDRDTWETTMRSFTICRFDFIYQLMKGMWYKHIFHNNTEKIMPSLRNDQLFFRKNHFFQPTFPIHIQYIQQRRLFWLAFFIEVFADFHKRENYYCLYYSLDACKNRKYRDWLNNNVMI